MAQIKYYLLANFSLEISDWRMMDCKVPVFISE